MALSKTAKIVLVLVALGALVPIALVVGGVFWFRANKDQLMEGAKQAVTEGEAFGAAHTQAECITEGLQRNGSCHGVMCEAGVNIFLGACLKRSPEDGAICAGVPLPGAILKSVEWQRARCADVGRANDQSCARLMKVVQSHCQGQ